MTFEEYVIQNMTAEAPAPEGPPPDYLQEEREEADRIARAVEFMEIVEAEIERGTEPQFILYTALKALSLFANAPDFLERTEKQLDAIYKDLAQQSLFNDNAIIAGERISEKTRAYIDKTRKQFDKQLKSLEKMESEILRARSALDNLQEDSKPPHALEWDAVLPAEDHTKKDPPNKLDLLDF